MAKRPANQKKKKQSTDRSKLLNSLKKRSKGAWKRARATDAKAKGSRLPDGLVNAVAKLTGWKMAMNKKNHPYFTLTGVVQEPEEYLGVKATVIHTISETQSKTIEEKLESLSSDLQLLGADMEGVELDDLPDVIEAWVEEGPYFKFNTWNPGDRDSPFVFVQGLAEDWEDADEDEDEEVDEEEDEEDDEEVDDDDEEEEYEEEEEEDPDDSEEEEEDEEEYEDEDEDEEVDEDEDEDEEVDEEEDEEEDDWVPAKTEVYMYKASSRSKPAECEVTTVSTAKETVTLKRVSDKKLFKNVPWDKLEGAE